MAVVGMKLMPPKAIGRKVCLQAKNLFRLLKNHGPKRRPSIERKEESKETKDFMKVEDGGVHNNRYQGHCTKQ